MPQNETLEFKVAKIVKDSGGEVIGRIRLQKLAYLLDLAGLGDGFEFEYRQFGPYSKILADASHRADLQGLITEKEVETDWGGFYSIFKSDVDANYVTPKPRKQMAKLALDANSIVLELAATAAFFAATNHASPWKETVSRKPQKAIGRIDAAKALYLELMKVEVPVPLPDTGL